MTQERVLYQSDGKIYKFFLNVMQLCDTCHVFIFFGSNARELNENLIFGIMLPYHQYKTEPRFLRRSLGNKEYDTRWRLTKDKQEILDLISILLDLISFENLIFQYHCHGLQTY